MLIRNIWTITVCALLESIQAACLLVFVLGHYKPLTPLGNQVLPEWQYLLRPEWETVIYRFWIVSAFMIAFFLFMRARRQMETHDLFKSWQLWLRAEGLVTFLILAASFKAAVFSQRADLASGFLIVLFIYAILQKFAWSWINNQITAMAAFLINPRYKSAFYLLASWAFAILIIALIAIPRPDAVVARNFIGEQFHHNDSFIMGPGWAFLSGAKLDIDVISQYGIGFPVCLALLAKWLGGFSYERIITLMMILTVIYYVAWWWLLRRWLGSLLIATAALLIGIKIQLFHEGAYPIVFTYGSMTPVRFIYDVMMFSFLYLHLVRRQWMWLALAGASAGFGVYYLTSEGVYGCGAYAAYLLIIWILSKRDHASAFWPKPLWQKACLAIIPALAWFVPMYLTVGTSMFSSVFWSNVGEFIVYFLSGFGVEPFYKNLQTREFWRFFSGCVIPISYVFILLLTSVGIWTKRMSDRAILVIVLCLYGLGTFHYYVVRSTMTNYATVILPLIWCLAFYVAWGLKEYAVNHSARSKWIKLSCVGMALYCLMTTHMFISYPNIFNMSRHPMVDLKVAQLLPDGRPYFNHLFRDYPSDVKLSRNNLGQESENILSEYDFKSDDQLVNYYHQASDFSVDALLIKQLTPPWQPAPVISSFEIKLLMQANRRPYFYYFPLVISRPMTMRNWAATSIYTTDQMSKVLKKLQDDKPPYIFVEKIFLTPQVPQAYVFQFPGLVILMQYLSTTYEPVMQGQYLMALKRRDAKE